MSDDLLFHDAAPLDVVLPVHNEGASIAATLREFHAQVAATEGVALRFVVSEDGSTDDTVGVLRTLERELPIHLLTAPGRKGYSRAVIDGLRATTSELVAFIDSDGQCDPRDLAALRARIGEADLVLGYRHPRRDPWNRVILSRCFHLVYRALLPVRVRDPSCPYLIVRRSLLASLLRGNIGVLQQGFWWEFIARATALGARIVEVPVAHRPRAAGKTTIYTPTRIWHIGAAHVRGLFRLRTELASTVNAQDTNVHRA